MNELEQQLEQAFEELEISEEQQESLRAHLKIVRNRDEETWAHSVRVELKVLKLRDIPIL